MYIALPFRLDQHGKMARRQSMPCRHLASDINPLGRTFAPWLVQITDYGDITVTVKAGPYWAEPCAIKAAVTLTPSRLTAWVMNPDASYGIKFTEEEHKTISLRFNKYSIIDCNSWTNIAGSAIHYLEINSDYLEPYFIVMELVKQLRALANIVDDATTDACLYHHAQQEAHKNYTTDSVFRKLTLEYIEHRAHASYLPMINITRAVTAAYRSLKAHAFPGPKPYIYIACGLPSPMCDLIVGNPRFHKPGSLDNCSDNQIRYAILLYQYESLARCCGADIGHTTTESTTYRIDPKYVRYSLHGTPKRLTRAEQLQITGFRQP